MYPSARVNRNRVNAARALPLKRARFWQICLFFLVWMLVIAGRMLWLQVVRYDEFKNRAAKLHESKVDVPPRRGSLLDRNLRELAMTVQVESVYAVPADVDDKPTAAHRLAALVHIDADDPQTSEEQIAARLASGHNSIRVAKGVSSDVAAQVTALGIKGIYLQKEFQRSYPEKEIAAQVLGFVGADDSGLGGLEQKYEALLHGVPGHMSRALDARRHVMGSSEDDPQPGRTLVLTIDETIQFMAERALDGAMRRTQAASGTVVVQDVHSGEILALAIRPTFDPNFARRATPDLLRNYAVSDVYEPGSTFKLVTYSAALDQQVVKPDDKIDCQGGQIKLPGRVIHDDKGEHFGVIPVHEALEHSSDVAAVKLALKLGPDRFYRYIHDFGFGVRSGVELPAETRGLLQPVKKWGVTSIGSIAMGQEVAVTPLQLVSMVSTIANGGVYLPPHVLMPGQVDHPGANPPPAAAQVATPFKPGGELPNPLPAGAHRVISTLTAAQMRTMMEGVVLYGTGKAARLNGYSSGGKTGTAQKIDPDTNHYSKTMHVASFAGIAPVNNPVIAVAVIIDSPRGDYYGASVSAPVFTEVAQQILEYLGVPHDTEVHTPRAGANKDVRVVEDEGDEHSGNIEALYSAANDLPNDDPLRGMPSQPVPQAKPAVQSKAASAGAQAATASAAPPAAKQLAQTGAEVSIGDAKRLRVPSLAGLPMRKVIELAAAAGLEVQINGSGSVREQAPAAGTLVPPGTKIVVRCGR